MLLDEHLSQKDYIKYIENKIVENIGFLYREKIITNGNLLHTLYFSYIHISKLCKFSMRQYSQKKIEKTIQSAKACNTIKQALITPKRFTSRKQY